MSGLSTRATVALGCRHPIVQTGMGWVAGSGLVAATSAAGAFGILASATMTLHELEAAIGRVRARTNAPFGVNLRADQADAPARVELMVRHGVRVASFAGPPRKELVGQLRQAGVLVVPTIGQERHALKMLDLGVDGLIAQGGEGGGHTGSVPTSILLPQVCAAVRSRRPEVFVLGAGGFSTGRGLVAALALGADGVAMGTRFLLTAESHVPAVVKERYLAAGVTDTVVTTAVDGSPQRVLRTPIVDVLERAGPLRRVLRALLHALAFRRSTGAGLGELLREGAAMRRSQGLSWAQVFMAANAPMMTRAALVEGSLEAGVFPTGQVTGAIAAAPPAREVIEQIVEEAEAVLRELAGRVG